MSLQAGPKLLPPDALIETLLSRDNFLITTHVNPDGDAIGSSLALAAALESIGKKTVLLDKHPIPSQYLFLPGQDRFETFEAFNASGKRIADFDTLVMVDCNYPDRIGLSTKEVIPAIEELKSAIAGGMFAVVIDHHQTENGFGNERWISPETAATGMLVFSVIKKLGVTVTQEMAKNIYTAIVTDTGNFRFGNTDAEVFRVAAELIDYGVSSSEIY
jgi:phosphoesterase RecJ-like protein